MNELVFSSGHPMFAGHFPHTPIVPGVMLLDAAVHAIEASPAMAWRHIAAVKFFRPVRPGEMLALSWTRSPDGSVHFEWRIGDERVASGTFSTQESVDSALP